MTTMLEAALAYAARGWRVFPCKGKEPRVKHGRNDATTDETQIRAWWRKWPDANVAIATGWESGLYVVDVDNAEDHARLIGPNHFPATLTVESRAGHRHLYFKRPPSDEKVKGFARRVNGRDTPGTDVRCDGGYVVAPPSIHPDTGDAYRFVDEAAAVADVPQWFLALTAKQPKPEKASKPKAEPPPPSSRTSKETRKETRKEKRERAYFEAALRTQTETVKSAAEGTRNETLNVAAFAVGKVLGSFPAAGSRNAVEAELYAAARAVGLEEHESRNTIRSGLDGGIAAGEREPLQMEDRAPPPRAPRSEPMDSMDPETPDPLAGMGEGLPQIEISTEEGRVVDASIRALARHPDVFHRAGALVDIHREPPFAGSAPGAPLIRRMPLARVRELCAATAAWVKVGTDKETGEPRRSLVHPPQWAVQALHARGSWPALRGLRGVAESPFLRPDGTVAQVPGYDDATGVVLHPSAQIDPVPEMPTREQAEAARDALLELVQDVPFKGPEHRAAWLAALLTPFARFGFHGPAPLTLVTANVAAAGKGLTCDLIGLVFTGREMAKTANVRDDDEMRKKITALALAGDPLVLIDNVKDRLGTPSLDAALTSTEWGDRMLGTLENVRAPLTMTWFCTGNNTTLAGDMARRTLHIRLESPHDNPEARRDFKRPHLKSWVQENRPRLAAAALTILRAYAVAGRPDMRIGEWGSFEGWSRTVRQAVVWCGMPDPGATREQLREEADTELQALHALLVGMEGMELPRQGVTARELVRRVEDDRTGRYEGVRSALEELTAGKGSTDKLNTHRVGNVLRRFRGRRVRGRRLMQAPTGAHGHVAMWNVDVESPAVPHESPVGDAASESHEGDEGGTYGTEGLVSNLHARARAHARARERNQQGAAEVPQVPRVPQVPETDDLIADLWGPPREPDDFDPAEDR